MSYQKLFTLNLNCNADDQMIEYLSSQANKQAYLKQLIAEDMKQQGVQIDDKRPLRKNIRSMIHRAEFTCLSAADLESIQDFIAEKMNNAAAAHAAQAAF